VKLIIRLYIIYIYHYIIHQTGEDTMSLKRYFIDFLIIGVITFITAAIVTYLYTLIVHGSGVVNWETAIDMAIILGIVLSVTQTKHENI